MSDTASSPSFKERVISAVIDRLREELAVMVSAARSAHEAATHGESAAEDQYDTRGIEASYLAGAQAQRAIELEKRIGTFQAMLSAAQTLQRSSIDVGALVRLKCGQRETLYFFVGDGGGVSVQTAGKTVNLITPQAPLGEALLGKSTGDEVDLEVNGQIRDYEVMEVS